jgi:predicted enzyme related to lactoylglutathione lyase
MENIMETPFIHSQITFLYYKDLQKAAEFCEKVMKFELCDDQGAAKIYRVSPNAFIGIVDEKKGHCRAQDTNAVLITLVVEDVDGWYNYLRKKGIKLLSEVKQPSSFPVRCFFFEDTEGYQYEIQKFLHNETAKKFKQY